MKKLIKFSALVAAAAIALASCSGAVDPASVNSSKTLTETIQVKGYSCKGWADVNPLPAVPNAVEGDTIEIYFDKGSAAESWGYQARMMLGDGNFALGTAFTFQDLEKDDAAAIDSVIEDIRVADNPEWGSNPNLINKTEKEYPKTPAGTGKVLLKIKLSANNGGNDTLNAFKNGKVTFCSKADDFVITKMVLISSEAASGVPVRYTEDKEIKIPTDGIVTKETIDKYSDDVIVTLTITLPDAAEAAKGTVGYIRGKNGKKSENDIAIAATGATKIVKELKKSDIAKLLETGGITFVPEENLYAELEEDEVATAPDVYYYGLYIPGGLLSSDDAAKAGDPKYYLDPESAELGYRMRTQIEDARAEKLDAEYAYKPVTTLAELTTKEIFTPVRNLGVVVSAYKAAVAAYEAELEKTSAPLKVTLETAEADLAAAKKAGTTGDALKTYEDAVEAAQDAIDANEEAVKAKNGVEAADNACKYIDFNPVKPEDVDFTSLASDKYKALGSYYYRDDSKIWASLPSSWDDYAKLVAQKWAWRKLNAPEYICVKAGNAVVQSTDPTVETFYKPVSILAEGFDVSLKARDLKD